ncbi:MAG: hypothetical protein ACREEK_17690 [Bradyrhizobium sp.]
MPLHRDIHWIGRQWAVTGHGLQLIDQKLKGFFDIEASRLWEEPLVETMRAKEWLNVADFDKGLEVARKRFPPDGVAQSPPAETVAPPPPVAPSVLPVAPQVMPIAPVAIAPAAVLAAPPSAVTAPAAAIESRLRIAKPEVAKLQKLDPITPPPAPSVALQRPAIKTLEPVAAQSAPPKFHMLFPGNAKFIRPWRVRMRK